MRTIKKYILGMMILSSVLSFQVTGKSEQRSTVVKIGGKKYYLQRDENTLVSMLRSKNRAKEIEAVEVLLRTPDDQLPRSKELMYAMIDLYKTLPPPSSVYKYGEDKDEDAVRKMQISLFTMIVGSGDPRGAVILKEAIESDNEVMRKIGLLLKETLKKALLEREREREKIKKGESLETKKVPVPIAPAIMDVSIGTAETLKALLSEIITSSPLEVKLETLKQLRKQASYLKSKEGEAKRVVIVNMLKDHYKTEKKLAMQGAIIGDLLDIGKEEEIRPFYEEIVRDEKAPRLLRNTAQLAIRILDAERAMEK